MNMAWFILVVMGSYASKIRVEGFPFPIIISHVLLEDGLEFQHKLPVLCQPAPVDGTSESKRVNHVAQPEVKADEMDEIRDAE